MGMFLEFALIILKELIVYAYGKIKEYKHSDIETKKKMVDFEKESSINNYKKENERLREALNANGRVVSHQLLDAVTEYVENELSKYDRNIQCVWTPTNDPTMMQPINLKEVVITVPTFAIKTFTTRE